MADLGPDPDRSVSGSFAPGADTGLEFVDSIAGLTFDQLHLNWDPPIALMIVADLGSLAPGAFTVVAGLGPPANDQIQFVAVRASGAGSTVQLGFRIREEFSADYAEVYAPPVSWREDREYSWAAHAFSGSDRSVTGRVSGSSDCTPQISGPGDLSGTGHLLYNSVNGMSFFVGPAAPSDLRVTYMAAWWDPPSPTAPSVTQFSNRHTVFTCQAGGWTIDSIGMG